MATQWHCFRCNKPFSGYNARNAHYDRGDKTGECKRYSDEQWAKRSAEGFAKGVRAIGLAVETSIIKAALEDPYITLQF